MRFKILEDKIDSLARTNLSLPSININCCNNNINTNTNTNNNSTVVICSADRLLYLDCMYVLFIILNILLPGIGTIIAGAIYGRNTLSNRDRTGAVICHGVIQFLTCWLLFLGWIWGIR